MRAIIPCSGFGTRLGMALDQSKEMLPDNTYGAEHLIDFTLQFCKINNIEPFVITRKDKKDLIAYLNSLNVPFMLYEPKLRQDWYHTVLASKDHWAEENILILPDTRFGPLFLGEMEKSLKLGTNAVFALHKVDNPEKWGIINDYKLYEKPKKLKGQQLAWGLIGFRKSYGRFLFANMKYIIKLRNVSFTFLDFFKDVTRGKDV